MIFSSTGYHSFGHHGYYELPYFRHSFFYLISSGFGGIIHKHIGPLFHGRGFLVRRLGDAREPKIPPPSHLKKRRGKKQTKEQREFFRLDAAKCFCRPRGTLGYLGIFRDVQGLHRVQGYLATWLLGCLLWDEGSRLSGLSGFRF